MKPVPHQKLYSVCDPKTLTFNSTRNLDPLNEIVGQQRAQEAVRFAMSMDAAGYNIYAVGRDGLGKRTMVIRYLKEQLKRGKEVFDWCYVSNFSEPRNPKVLKLPAGVGKKFKQDVEKLSGFLVKAIPSAFDNDSYYDRSEQLKNSYADKQTQALEKLAKQAKRKHVKLEITTPGGYRLIAMNGDEVHTADSYEALSDEERKKFEESIDALEIRLRGVIRKLAAWEQEFSDKQDQLNNEVVLGVAEQHFQVLKKKYEKYPNLVSYFDDFLNDVVNNLDIFLEDGEDQAAFAYAALDKKMPRRYQVNVLVHSEDGKEPIVIEDSPNYHNLFGYVESVTYKGTVFTDFSLIRPGSLHKANGGYLLMDAIKVLEQPFVWDGLKRALRARKLHINSLEREVTLSGTISLEPEAVPLDLKIILFGDRQTYLLLQQYDPEFKELFKITADFENEMTRNKESEILYARFIASLVQDKGMLHCDRKAVARIIEYSSRQAEDQEKLSLHAADIANLLRESHFWAKEAGSKMIRLDHVEQALSSSEYRNNRLRDEMYESVKAGTTLLSVTGTRVGQVNALAVLTTGGIEFGMPNRISATCYYGEGAVMDIEHESKLGGAIHTKGVKILSSYLANIFAYDRSLPFDASITFEQSYGEVDGDSASVAELCALISALAEVPIEQRFAVTGSVNQFGDVQAVGGVNLKIEGFVSAIKMIGEVSQQAVILPESNLKHLMLNQDVIDAAKSRKFAVYGISRIEQALTLLTGLPVGEKDKKGNYPQNSIFGRIQARISAVRDLNRED